MFASRPARTPMNRLLCCPLRQMGLALRLETLTFTIGLARGALCTAAALLLRREMHDVLDAIRRKLSRRNRPAV